MRTPFANSGPTFTNSDKAKLDSIESNANNYELTVENDLFNPIVGGKLNFDNESTTLTYRPNDVPVASASTLGGVKVGANLSIDNNAVLSGSSSKGASFYLTSDLQNQNNTTINGAFTAIKSSSDVTQTSNGIFTLNTAGTYVVTYSAMVVKVGGGTNPSGASIFLLKNSGTSPALCRSVFNDAGGTDAYVGTSIANTYLADFAANDTISLRVEANVDVDIYGYASSGDGARTWITFTRLG